MTRILVCIVLMAMTLAGCAVWVGGGWEAQVATGLGRQLVLCWAWLGVLVGAFVGGMWESVQ